MLEVEMKFPGADFAMLERQLAEWGARADAPLDEADHYFNAPDRDFGQTDEAFRLRRVGRENRATYKGPKRAGGGKVRTEIEVTLAPGDEAATAFVALVQHLGYRPTAVVRKHRRMYHLRRDGYDLEVCLDAVDGLGRFAEVEIRAPEAEEQAAFKVLQEVAASLGLGAEERRSYLELLLARHQTQGKSS